MARKRVTEQSADPDVESTEELSRPKPDMESLNEELQNLKSLNSKVVREAFERKRQVDSLVQAKTALEGELERLSIEKVGLEDELNRAAEDGARSEIERSLLSGFIETQVGLVGANLKELGRETMEREVGLGDLRRQINELNIGLEEERKLSRLYSEERDMLNSELLSYGEEARGLRVTVLEFEKKERESKEKIGKLTVLWDDLKRRESEEIVRVRESADEKLKVKDKELTNMAKVLEVLKEEKKIKEEENDANKIRIVDLEKEVLGLNEVVLNSKREEEVLKEKIFTLESSYCEILEKVKAMEKLIGDLEEENSVKERKIQRLIEEKEANIKAHQLAISEKNDKEIEFSRLLMEKEEIASEKIRKETELLDLRKNVDTLKDDLVSLQSDIGAKDCKIEALFCDLNNHRQSIDAVELERDTLRKDLDEERENLQNLRSEVQKIEMGIEETAKELAKMKIENENLIKEKKEMERCIALLKKEKASVLSSLSDAQVEISAMKAKSESATAMSQKALAMLRDIAASVREPRNDRDNITVHDKNIDCEIIEHDEFETYAAELGTIRKAFELKEVAVKDMKQQVEVLQSSVEEANRKKGFLAIFSSITTIFAAIFLACGNRVR